MTTPTSAEPLAPLELDEHGNLRPFTEDQCLAVFTHWATNHPSARFVVVAIAPDGSDAEELGWGLALPDHVFTDLPEIGISGRFRTAGHLVRLLGRTMDARLIWVDPEPEYWPADTDEPAD